MGSAFGSLSACNARAIDSIYSTYQPLTILLAYQLI